MLKCFKFRMFPTKKQQSILDAQLENCRMLYNHFLSERKTVWEDSKESLNYYSQANTLKVLKTQFPSLNNIHSQILQNVAMRVDLAFKAFFRRCKTGEKPGYPRFKGFWRYNSMTFPQSGCGIKDGKLSVSKVGNVKIKQHRNIEGVIKTVTISRSSTCKWYVCFSCEIEKKFTEPLIGSVGIDVGISSFAYLSSGEEIANPKFFRQEEKALAKAQRKFSKCEKEVTGRKKAKRVVSRIHERIRFRRSNFTHQLSRKIIDSFGNVFVEDLSINRMVHNHCLAKSISDAAWGMFFNQLFYKAENAGGKAIKVNPAYTSQDCSCCGHRQKINLPQREYVCLCCGLRLHRDLNASLNILRLGTQSLDCPRSSSL